MGAPKNNEFYKLVKMPTGRPRAYTPTELWEKAQEYFKWVHENPLMESKVFGTGLTMKVPKMRAMTEIAFCLFASIDHDTFANYKSKKEPYKEFFGVTMAISNIIYTQKLEGAAADFLNANIIARDLGLRDNQDVTTKGKELNTKPILFLSADRLTDEQIEKYLQQDVGDNDESI
jgi:hypothetical protein